MLVSQDDTQREQQRSNGIKFQTERDQLLQVEDQVKAKGISGRWGIYNPGETSARVLSSSRGKYLVLRGTGRAARPGPSPALAPPFSQDVVMSTNESQEGLDHLWDSIGVVDALNG